MKKYFFGAMLTVALIVAMAIFVLIIVANTKEQSATTKGAKSLSVSNAGTRTVEFSGKYLFSGTIFWGRYFQDWAKKADGSLDYAYPFSGLNSFEPKQYDAWVADLECPVTDKDISSNDQEAYLTFNCRPEFLSEAAKYFTHVDFANNHSDNAGREGLIATKKRLNDVGIKTFGDYDPASKDQACSVQWLPIHEKLDSGAEQKGLMPVAFCAWHYFYRKPLPGEIEQMKQFAEVMPVFAFVHMGAEYHAKADPIQQEIAHQVIDAGASFVIANNPHWVQNSEVYKGKLIVYSTGNFIFDQQYNAEVTRSASISLNISSSKPDQLKAWQSLQHICSASTLDCLQEAKKRSLKKQELSFSFAVVAGQNENKVTHKATASVQSAVEERLNWSSTGSTLR